MKRLSSASARQVEYILVLVALVLTWSTVARAEQIPISDIQRETPVDFATEIFPILKQNCLACHHAKEAEGGLNLESHESLMKGGDSGAGVDAKNVAESQVLARASGTEGDIMPPEDNGVGAKPLTPEQLGLIQLWIQQGAKKGKASTAESIQWQPIPESFRAIYAIDVSEDGQFIAAGHANRAVIYDLATATETARLVDPSIESISGPGVADVDLIQSIAFSPDGNRIATGGFRSVRIWQKTVAHRDETPLASAAGNAAINADGSRVAIVNAIGDIEVWDTANKRIHTLSGHADRITGLVWAGDRIVSCDNEGRVIVWNAVDGGQLANKETHHLLTDLATNEDASAVAAVDAQGKLHAWRLSINKAGRMVFSAGNVNTRKAVSGAKAITFASKPTPQWIIATESSGALAFSIADDKQIRKFDHGSAVSAVAVNPEHSQLATAGIDGKIKLWQTADGKAIRTLQGSPKLNRYLAIAQRDAKRQADAVKRLTALTAVLEGAVKKEDEAVKKIVEARDKATKDLETKEKARVDAVAKVKATEATIAKANQDTAASKAASDTATKTIAEAQASIAKLNKEVETQNAALTKAKQAASKAEQTIAAAQKVLADAKTRVDQVTQQIAAKKAAIAKASQSVATANQKIASAKETMATAKTSLDSSTKSLDAQKKAVTAAEESKKKAEAEVAKRKQALAAAKEAQQRAKAAVPAHATRVAAASLRKGSLEKHLTHVQSQLANPINACIDVCFAPDGKTIASVHADQSARIYRTTDGLVMSTFDAADARSGVLLTASHLCALGQSSRTSVWSIDPTWTLERTIGSYDPAATGGDLISDRVTALDFRRDGLSLAVGSGPPSRSGDVKIFAVETGELVRDFGDVHSDTVLGLKFSPDGRSIASSAADKTVRMLDVASGKAIRSFEGHTHHVLAVDWQDDGETLASASADKNVKVWNAGTGEQRKTITGFGKEITAISFVQQSNQVVTACADGQLRLHDSSNARSLRTFNAAGDFLYSVAVTSDGKTLVAGGQAGILRVWNVADAKLLHEVK